jgi:predicted metalloprotease with PDZ domain
MPLLAAAITASTAAQPPVEYSVNLHSAHAQMVDMTMTLRGLPPGELEIALPVWRPGRYALVEPVTTLRDLSARAGPDNPIPLRKKDKSSWIATIPAGAPDITLTYRIFANSIADRTRHADDTHAFLSPSTVFLYAPTLRNHPLTVRVDAPQNWHIATGLEAAPRNPTIFHAPNYDILVDSPIEVGLHEQLSFEVDGIPHEIVIWNPTTIRRTLPEDRITGDFERIVRAHLDIFGALPYQRYVFLIHAYPGGRGGTEHLNSTIMGCNPEALREEEPYKRFLGLVSHEFHHTWNVKQFRPAGIHPYDYQRENYTGLLWVAEGTTSYYDDLALVRAGLMRPDDYLRALSTSIHNIRSRPGARVQSLEESSFDAWVKFNKSWPDSINTTVSFYDKGAHASMLLDMVIRQSSTHHSLDSVMREMFETFPPDGPGYTTDDFRVCAERYAGSDLADFFARYIAGTEELPLEDFVGAVGLELLRTGGGADRPYLGLNVAPSDSFVAISSTLADGPAHAAGLIAGDLIVSTNSRRIRSQSDLDAVVSALKPGDPITLSLFRHDTLREITVTLAARDTSRWTLRRVSEPTPQQKAAYRSWCGQPWPGDESPQAEQRPRPRRRAPAGTSPTRTPP